ncbi:MAG TPA: hypothetical protein VHL09_11425 [Dehalococcoidia bacterium]|nr:hypothetical protein [Dehalococcoidia bacterium]
MSSNREWLESWLSAKPKTGPERSAAECERNAIEAPKTDGLVLANLSPAGRRRLLSILEQNELLPTLRFVAFRAESFREKDLLDSFEAMIKQPNRRAEARYVPNRRSDSESDES